jgi:hypothetical protein
VNYLFLFKKFNENVLLAPPSKSKRKVLFSCFYNVCFDVVISFFFKAIAACRFRHSVQ